MPMFNPPHPGRIIRHRFIRDEDGNPIDSVANFADKLNCHRSTLNRLINCEASITPEMALALEKNGGGSAEQWLTMQANYDLFQLRQNSAA